MHTMPVQRQPNGQQYLFAEREPVGTSPLTLQNPSAGPFAPRTPYVAERVSSGDWREAYLCAADAGLTRGLRIFLATRKSSPIVHDWHGDSTTYCPPLYWDLAIGSGPCGLGCRGCYLIGTFRATRDPLQPLVYDNTAFFWEAARRWLIRPGRRSCHTLGLGTDRSDSLLFESITEHARRLISMFTDPVRNPHGCKLLLLTKSKNVRYLEGLPTRNVIVSFSLNPQPIADLWEGRWPDTLEPIPPPIEDRLAASLRAQGMGFEVRWRLDPILTPAGWQPDYRDFLRRAAAAGHRPTRITLGTYRETRPQLGHWRHRWGLPSLEWQPDSLARDGTHYRASSTERIAAYEDVASICREFLPASEVSLCKETTLVRKATGLASPACNCVA